jgi:hypothetical protein
MLLFAIIALAVPQVPGIDGHMTDPGHKLSEADKRSIEDRLGKIQEETHLDVAGWISDVPEGQAMALGNRAYRQWNIGRDWDGGVFLMFPTEGKVRIIQPLDRPTVPAGEVAQLVAADIPDLAMNQRIERLAEKARSLLVARTGKKARPWGDAHPELGHRWLMLAAAIVLGAAGMSFSRKRTGD